MYETLKFVVMGLELYGNSNSKTCNSMVAEKYTGDKKPVRRYQLITDLCHLIQKLRLLKNKPAT